MNGRTIDYVGFRDDGGDPATSAKAATQLVQQDHVFAVVPAVSPVLATVDLAAGNVPYFGWSLSSQFCETKLGFGFNGCLMPPGGGVTNGAWGRPAREGARWSGAGQDRGGAHREHRLGGRLFAAVSASVRAAGFTVVGTARALPVPAVGDFGGLAKKVMTSNSGKAPDVVSRGRLVLEHRAGQARAHRGRVQGPVHRLDRI